MKVAVTSSGPGLDYNLDPRFGRCEYFVIVDIETMEAKSIENPNVSLGGGAGIQSAQLMSDEEVNAVITGNIGPNAFRTLSAANMETYIGASGTVSNAIEQYKTGKLSLAEGASVASHSGMGGMGMGRMSSRNSPGMQADKTEQPKSAKEELDSLRQKTIELQKQMDTIMARIKQLKKDQD